MPHLLRVSIVAVFSCVWIISFSATEVSADIYTDAYEGSLTKGPDYESSNRTEPRTRKLFRGIGNITLCLGEIPVHAFREARATSPVTGTFVGTWRGTIKAGKRFGIGWRELVTFMVPNVRLNGTTDWEPLIEPEIVFMDAL